MRRELVCVSCPVGCQLTVEVQAGRVASVSGNRCPRGEAYAREEAVDSKRVLMSLVKVVGGERPVVSVKTDRPIPKRLIPQAMEIVRALTVPAPVRIEQVLAEDIGGTGANLVATRDVAQVR